MRTHRSAWGGALLLGLALGIAAGSATSAAAQIKWNLPGAYAADNYHSENLVFFAKEVEKETGGKLQITVHPGASLFKAPEIKRAVATGQAQLGEVLISIHENEEPVYGIDTIPFLATSFADAKKLHEARKATMVAKLDAQGLKLLYVVPWGPQGLYSTRPIATIEDLKGLKMRTYNVGTTRIAELVGAQGVTIQLAELPQALATGAVHAFMTSSSGGYDTKAWETVPYFYDCQAWIPANVIFVNKAAFASLDKGAQEALLTAAAAAEVRGWRIAEEKAGWYVEQLRAKGMKVGKPSPALTAGLKKLGEQLTADWIAKAGPAGKAVVDAYRK